MPKTLYSAFQLQFNEILNFQNAGPTGVCTIKDDSDDPVSSKCVGYLAELNALIVAVTIETGPRQQFLNLVRSDGTRSLFGGAQFILSREPEAHIAVVPTEGGPVIAGFHPGDVFAANTKANDANWEISQVPFHGFFPNLKFCAGDDTISGSLWGGIAFDNNTNGLFGGKLVAMTYQGVFYLVDSLGKVTLLVDLRGKKDSNNNNIFPDGVHLEGLIVAPGTFGTYASQILFGVETANSSVASFSDTEPKAGRIYALDALGNVALLADINFAMETLAFVPPTGGTYYQTILGSHKGRDNKLIAASASQFMGRVGHLIAGNEMGGELWDIAWDAANGVYTQTYIGRPPGVWNSQGFIDQGSELEQGAFAELKAQDLLWRADVAMPKQATTLSPCVLADLRTDTMRVFINSGGSIWHSSFGLGWSAWAQVVKPPDDIVTKIAPTCVSHHGVPYVFVVEDVSGAIKFTQLAPGRVGWATVPGSAPPQSTAVALSATLCGGRIVLAMSGNDEMIYINEMRPGGRNSWEGWSQVPGGPKTILSPTVVSFQDELYVFAIDAAGSVQCAARSTDGVWTDWNPPPAKAPLTVDRPLAAATLRISGPSFDVTQLHLFVRDPNPQKLGPLQLASSDTGTWNAWSALEAQDPRVSDVAMAATEFRANMYVFILDSADGTIYVRQSK